MSGWPFFDAQAGASRAKPGSDTVTRTSSPGVRSAIACDSFMIGPGQANPVQSRSISVPLAAAAPTDSASA